ncbi:hypothetical protein SSX86_032795 [Deinandra increscens subsp. villosa]|uniref:SPX domain-containing protein n=1 Tax=Deinandra increscens subsp. villosa TaxID=3103831 RepID=A0AAP0C4G0_9ASTR
MQFRKILEKLIDDMLPDWRDQFLYYKDLKQQLKRIYFRDGGGNKRMKLIIGHKVHPDPKEIAAFVQSCDAQIVKFNNFVLDQQEWYIIKIEVLEGNLLAAKGSNEELMKVLADLHGEIILLLHYSSFNYTGLAKILKKYDKLSGALVRVPFIQKVLNEPFYEADVLNSLVKKCEAMLGEHFPVDKQQGSRLSRREEELATGEEEEEKCFTRVPELEHVEMKNMENRYLKLTLSALEALREIRNGSSTVSMFSLPPMSS